MSTKTVPEINNPITAAGITAPVYPEINTREMAKNAYEFFNTIEMDDDYTEFGIRCNINDWAKNKMPLIELLRKHPNWNEEAKAVILHSDINRCANINEALNAVDYIYNGVKEKFEQFSFDRDTWYKYLDTRPFIKTLINNGNLIGEESSDDINRLNAMYPDLRARVGQKTSRVINKLFGIMGFKALPEYNRLYAKLSDAANPLTVKTTTILSVHWMDFLTMSRGNSWSSCHGIESNADYSGCYKAGCLSYANDDVSLIFYTVNNGYNGNTPWKEKKITRQVFFYKDGVLVQERLYPQCNDSDEGTGANSQVRQYRTIVESIFAVCENRPNLWKKHKQVNIDKNDDCFMYDDWNYFRNWKVCFNDIDEKQTFKIFVGAESYCLECGRSKEYRNHDDGARTLMCKSCYNCEEECYECGSMHDPDNMYLIDGNYYCSDCTFYCDYHEEREICDDEAYVLNYGYVCQEALSSGEFIYCDHCDDYVYDRCGEAETVNTETGEEVWCRNCIDNRAVRCDNCGKFFDSSMHYLDTDNGVYCLECIDDYIEKHEIDIDENDNVHRIAV